MIKHFETTVFVLIWCLILSYGWAALSYLRLHDDSKPKRSFGVTTMIPALVLTPFIIRGVYDGLGLNLIYPIHLLTSAGELFVRAIVPALVLVLASGLLFQISSAVPREFLFWRKMPFAQVTEAFGRSAKREMKKLVIAKAFVESWQSALPWLFGELIVVEALFNAPGLASELWRTARVHDWLGLTQNALWLIIIYYLLAELAAQISRVIGRRLAGYA